MGVFYCFVRVNALCQVLVNTQMSESNPACLQVMSFSIALAWSRIRDVDQIAVWVTKTVNPHRKIKAMVVPVLEFDSLRLFGCRFDNLVNPLSGEVITVGDLCERLAVFAEIPDFRVSGSIRFGTCPEGAPGPSGHAV